MIWLASFPRSGNIWVRFIVTSIVYGDNLNSVELTGEKGELYRKTHRFINDNNKSIYIIRNPLDVYRSLKGYYRKFHNQKLSIRKLIKNYKHGRWDNHVNSWLGKNPFIVKYEDMKNDLNKVIDGIIDFIDINPKGDPYIFSTTKRMKLLQEKSIKGKINSPFYNPKREKIYIKGSRLIGTRMAIGESDIELICNEFGNTMKKVGYETIYTV